MYYTLKVGEVSEAFESLEIALEKIKNEYQNETFVLIAGHKEYSPKELKEKIKQKGLKLAWIATKIEISPSHLSNCLRGNVKMTKDIHDKILKHLD